ncbi:hypothetical protein WICMUC_004594 [Wickerhamomyces mucosus]|uniref:PWWP domain-containing protein n=1 Tax=Wickerhamomyces mucosus TaxID=1378264 RepID=A0A9P8PG70_9ASCO|nr:hypothetical protein WICMUC_004594 [Wickerhamomyces mucosus]
MTLIPGQLILARGPWTTPWPAYVLPIQYTPNDTVQQRSKDRDIPIRLIDHQEYDFYFIIKGHAITLTRKDLELRLKGSRGKPIFAAFKKVMEYQNLGSRGFEKFLRDSKILKIGEKFVRHKKIGKLPGGSRDLIVRENIVNKDEEDFTSDMDDLFDERPSRKIAEFLAGENITNPQEQPDFAPSIEYEPRLVTAGPSDKEGIQTGQLVLARGEFPFTPAYVMPWKYTPKRFRKLQTQPNDIPVCFLGSFKFYWAKETDVKPLNESDVKLRLKGSKSKSSALTEAFKAALKYLQFEERAFENFVRDSGQLKIHDDYLVYDEMRERDSLFVSDDDEVSQSDRPRKRMKLSERKALLKPGDLVIAKIYSFPYWPGYIVSAGDKDKDISGVNKSTGDFSVRFYGDSLFYWLSADNIRKVSKREAELCIIDNHSKRFNMMTGDSRVIPVADTFNQKDFENFMKEVSIARSANKSKERAVVKPYKPRKVAAVTDESFSESSSEISNGSSYESSSESISESSRKHNGYTVDEDKLHGINPQSISTIEVPLADTISSINGNPAKEFINTKKNDIPLIVISDESDEETDASAKEPSSFRLGSGNNQLHQQNIVSYTTRSGVADYNDTTGSRSVIGRNQTTNIMPSHREGINVVENEVTQNVGNIRTDFSFDVHRKNFNCLSHSNDNSQRGNDPDFHHPEHSSLALAHQTNFQHQHKFILSSLKPHSEHSTKEVVAKGSPTDSPIHIQSLDRSLQWPMNPQRSPALQHDTSNHNDGYKVILEGNNEIILLESEDEGGEFQSISQSRAVIRTPSAISRNGPQIMNDREKFIAHNQQPSSGKQPFTLQDHFRIVNSSSHEYNSAQYNQTMDTLQQHLTSNNNEKQTQWITKQSPESFEIQQDTEKERPVHLHQFNNCNSWQPQTELGAKNSLQLHPPYESVVRNDHTSHFQIPISHPIQTPQPATRDAWTISNLKSFAQNQKSTGQEYPGGPSRADPPPSTTSSNKNSSDYSSPSTSQNSSRARLSLISQSPERSYYRDKDKDRVGDYSPIEFWPLSGAPDLSKPVPPAIVQSSGDHAIARKGNPQNTVNLVKPCIRGPYGRQKSIIKRERHKRKHGKYTMRDIANVVLLKFNYLAPPRSLIKAANTQ